MKGVSRLLFNLYASLWNLSEIFKACINPELDLYECC